MNKIYENLMRTVYDIQVVNAEAKNDPKRFVETAESIYHRQIDSVCAQILFGGYKIVLVCGPSSAGKTTSSKLIIRKLEEKGLTCKVVSTDDFFINRDDTPTLPSGAKDYDNVTTVDIPCFRKFLVDLTTNGKADLPQFDFMSGTRKGYVPMDLGANDVFIIEGIHAHNPLLIDCIPLEKVYKVYISLSSDFVEGDQIILRCKDLRLMRRLIRDYYGRGQSIQNTLKQWAEVRRCELKFVTPYKKEAHFVIDTTHLYEPLIYDNYLLPLLKATEQTPEVKKLINAFDHTGKISKEYIPNDSLLWEFVKKEF